MRIAKCFDGALICQVVTKGVLYKFANKKCACDICESHKGVDEESNHLGYYTMSAGEQLPMSLTCFFRICQSEKSRHATIILWVYYVGAEE
jgi:hypothetical protein